MPPLLGLVVATANPGKLVEIRALLRELPVEIVSMTDALGEAPVIVEDGATFEDNALIKARHVAAETMMITVADDSGLEVDALGGRPGVRSRRFAHEGATDAENNAELLRRMLDVETAQRSARFSCAIALVDPWSDAVELARGSCEGRIAHRPSGAGGFGYDPLFLVEGGERTMAELDEEEKNRVSHRGRALRAMRPLLEALLDARLLEAARVLSGGGR